MSMPGDYDLNIYRGDTYHWQFKLWQDAHQQTAVDLTGVTAAAQIRDQPKGQNITNMTCTVTLPNIIDVILPASMSHVAFNGVWDLELTGPNGVTTIVMGGVTVTDDVTNSA